MLQNQAKNLSKNAMCIIWPSTDNLRTEGQQHTNPKPNPYPNAYIVHGLPMLLWIHGILFSDVVVNVLSLHVQSMDCAMVDMTNFLDVQMVLGVAKVVLGHV